MTSLIYQVTMVFTLVVFTNVLIATEDLKIKDPPDEKDSNSTEIEILSPAEELLIAAKRAGYNLTLEVFDDAEKKTDEELQEIMPAPVAEAYIDHRRRDNLDIIREQMIGMIFTGQPMPLGSHGPMWRPSRRRNEPYFGGIPNQRRNGHNRFQNPDRFYPQFDPKEIEAPGEILKPYPFVPSKSQIQFPQMIKNNQNHPPRRNRPNFPPQNIQHSPSNNHRTHNRQRPNDFPKLNDNFGNTLGPDFGPVTFEDFGSNIRDSFGPDFSDAGNKFSKPVSAPSPPTRRPHRPPNRRPGRPSNPFSSSSSSSSGGFSGFSSNTGGTCKRYTEDICLDVTDYPHEAILSSLARDPSRADTMIADEEDQSADQLVDGITAAMEERYDFTHYFGNRRQDSHVHRDFADDGGYLCPSEVKYARPKRARNSKGEWKFVVNMDKYTQTIRMEKCLKPGGACSYVSHHYRATCKQIYNYQRLLSWEDKRGLHMDIYKVPSCCSCHIQGYAYVFPPLGKKTRQSFSGSDAQETLVRPPKNYPPGNRQTPQQRSPQSRPTGQRQKEANDRSNNGDRLKYRPSEDVTGRRPTTQPDDSTSARSRVNYHYHPIIDYFENF